MLFLPFVPLWKFKVKNISIHIWEKMSTDLYLLINFKMLYMKACLSNMLKKTFFMKQLFYFHFIYKKNELSDTIKESLSAFQRNKNIRCR